MSAFKFDDKALDHSQDFSFSSLAEENSQTSTSSVTRTNASSVSEHKVNLIAKVFFV